MTDKSFEEGICIGMLFGGSVKKPVIKSLSVTENGSYKAPEGVDGYNPVNVNVPSEAVTEGLSVTSNGTYTPPSGVDGYNPVTVNVPDRYDDGYQEGYEKGYQDGYKDGYDDGYADGMEAVKSKIQPKTITENGTYNAEDDDLYGYNPVTVNVAAESDGYTFPDGTSYEDIYKFVGADTVTDKTLGRYIKSNVDETDTGYNVTVMLYYNNGISSIALSGGGYGKPLYSNLTIDSVFVNSSTGDFDVAISYDMDGEHYTIHQTGTHNLLVGFGSSDHTISVKNN